MTSTAPWGPVGAKAHAICSRPQRQKRALLSGAARPDYYENGGESPGQSHFNEMSYAYGLHRTVEKEVIEKLLDGYHPRTGEPLAQNHGKEDRRAAVDICYSVPKDVSAAWAAADEPERRRIEKALDKAVTEAAELPQ